MIKSMTGFGRSEDNDDFFKVTLEIKTVNNRFLDLNIKIPKAYQTFENRIKTIVKQQIQRGRVDLFFSIEEIGEKKVDLKIEEEMALKFFAKISGLAQKCGVDKPENYFNKVLELPEVLKIEKEVVDLEQVQPLVEKVLEDSLEKLVEMRAVEGQQMADDLQNKTENIAELVYKIQAKSDSALNEYREKLKKRMQEVLQEVPVDEVKLLNEVAFYADKTTIDEELVRLKSHLDQIDQLLNSSGPVGRKLDFIMQELNREINTVGSKVNDLEITQDVVAVKAVLENIREQVQNIE